MALQIANPTVMAKVDRLARTTGLSKMPAVEWAIDLLLAQQEAAEGNSVWDRRDAILNEIDRVPDNAVPFDPLDWDEHGLP